jgi:toxin ParE1/3/4
LKKIRWLEIALQDLDESADYIARYNLTAAQKLVRRIEKAVPTLSDNPEMGRPGRVPGTRELVITGTSYIVAYRLKDNEIQILRILHGARKWPGKFHD